MPSDSGLTAAEQAALDADRAAETQVEEEVAATPAAGSPTDAGDGAAGEVGETAADGQATQRQEMVPHAALHEAREKEITRLATIAECADIARSMQKHGSPVGDAYSNGVWDQGVRIEQKIRGLSIPSTEGK